MGKSYSALRVMNRKHWWWILWMFFSPEMYKIIKADTFPTRRNLKTFVHLSYYQYKESWKICSIWELWKLRTLIHQLPAGVTNGTVHRCNCQSTRKIGASRTNTSVFLIQLMISYDKFLPISVTHPWRNPSNRRFTFDSHPSLTSVPHLAPSPPPHELGKNPQLPSAHHSLTRCSLSLQWSPSQIASLLTRLHDNNSLRCGRCLVLPHAHCHLKIQTSSLPSHCVIHVHNLNLNHALVSASRG